MSDNPKKVSVCGMQLDEWIYQSCMAHFGVGEDFATLYDIISLEKRKGHAEILLIKAKKYYEEKGLKFGGSIALNDAMRNLYKKLKIKEYTNGY